MVGGLSSSQPSMAVDFSLFGGADSLTEDRAPRRAFVPGTESGSAATHDYAGPPQDPRDFLWLMTEEPHRTRRTEIMQAHPEVTKLMGHEPLTKYVAFAVVSLQIATAVYLRHTHPLSLWFVVCAYAVGGTANHNLFLAIHEITHNLAFRGVVMNRLLAVFANLPIGIPYAAAFKVRRLDAWKYCGVLMFCWLCWNRNIISSITSFWVRMGLIRICLRDWNCCF